MADPCPMRRSFPLDWPEAQLRTTRPEVGAPAGCKDSLNTAHARIAKALNLPGFADVVLSSNAPVNARGEWAEGRMSDHDGGVALAFSYRGRAYHVGQDIWRRPAHNAWSLALMSEGLRQSLRHAGDGLFARMIEGFAALPPPAGAAPARAGRAAATAAPHAVLGVARDAPRAVVEAAYRALARDAHPDRGGTTERMTALSAARDAMLQSGRA